MMFLARCVVGVSANSSLNFMPHAVFPIISFTRIRECMKDITTLVLEYFLNCKHSLFVNDCEMFYLQFTQCQNLFVSELYVIRGGKKNIECQVMTPVHILQISINTCNPGRLVHPEQNRHVEAADPETRTRHRLPSCCLLHKMHPSET